MNIDNLKNICVGGWGKTGISLCNLLLALNKRVRVSEMKERGSFPSSMVDSFIEKGVKIEFGGHTKNFIKGSQLLVISPGIDTINSPLIKFANELGILCVGEIEFCFWLSQAKFVAITGTNGKTTTTHLTHEILKKKRKRVFLGGNIGIPLSSLILNTKKNDIVVVEVSSFQLETIIEFKPYVAALLNIEPDHLDRYPRIQAYLDAKLNIFKKQDTKDWAILNKNINFRSKIEKGIKAQKVYFSNELFNENFSCVYKIASIFGVSKIDCINMCSSFNGLPHRLEFVKNINGVNFINDSKATNPSSTIWALKNIKTPIILLAGGKDKGLDYSLIRPYLKKVKKINLFGEASSKIKGFIDKKIRTESFSSLQDIIASSFNEAKTGDTILFSPMCASYDMFDNYMQRGSKFIEIVNNLVP